MRGWSIFFALAAAFNLAIGLYVMAVPASFAGANLAPAELLSPRIIGWFIFVFGIGYAIVATAPARHEGIVRIGLIGKLGFVVLMAIAYGADVVTEARFIPALADLPWVVAFFVFLRRQAVR